MNNPELNSSVRNLLHEGTVIPAHPLALTKDRKLVQEAVKLFEADTQRQPYTAGSSAFIVSPINAREKLGEFIAAAKKDLLIYDPNLSDPKILKLLEERIKAGVEVRLISPHYVSPFVKTNKSLSGSSNPIGMVQ